ncbi:MAG: cupin, partial [Verrucomicrobiaceae bacterium]
MSDDVRNVLDALSTISGYWQPHRLTSINDYDVKVVKLHGEFVWH